MRIKLEDIAKIYGEMEPGRSAAEVYNEKDEYSYGLDLAACEVDYDQENDMLTFTGPVGVSKKCPFGTTFSYDGLGWGDETRYVFGEAGWMERVETFGLQVAHQKAAMFYNFALGAGCNIGAIETSICASAIVLSCPDHDVFRALRTTSRPIDPIAAAVVSTLNVTIKKDGYVNIGPDEIISLTDAIAATTAEERLKMMAEKMVPASRTVPDLTKLAS